MKNSNFAKKHYNEIPFDLVPVRYRYMRLLEEQHGKCAVCSMENMWNGKPLRFQIDHISGNSKDNSRENLRAICPNCHSQTDTWGYKNSRTRNVAQRTPPTANPTLVYRTNARWEIYKERIKMSSIDFSKYGWVNRVSEVLGITPQNVNKWMKRHLPEVYTSAFKRKNRFK